MNWKNINTLIPEISNNNLELPERLKKGITIMIFISVVSFMRFTLSPALFSSYQKKKFAGD